VNLEALFVQGKARSCLQKTKYISRTILKKLLNGTKHIFKKTRMKFIIVQNATSTA